MASSIISSVVKELGARIASEVGFMWNANKDLENIKSELLAINSAAEIADGLPYFMTEGVKDWLQKLKEVAYDAEDVIDEYQAESTNDDHNGMLVMGKWVCAESFTLLVSCLCKHLVRRYQLGKKIKEINDRLTQISKERERYKLQEMVTAAAAIRTTVDGNRETTYLMANEDIVGRVSDRDELVEKLHSKRTSLFIVSIVGIGGLGKTTLARMVFNDDRVKRHFKECRWWICVSQGAKGEDVAKKMLPEVNGSAVEQSGLNTLCRVLEEELSKKKFWLVLDDVWDSGWWKELEALFKKGSNGSRILMTTRMQTISAEFSAATHEPTRFSFNESWQLFLRKSLKEDETEEVLERMNLKDVGEDIVRKCGGLPIAVEAVGSAMRLKRREREDWKCIAESGIWKLNRSFIPGLILSYDVLPPVSKRFLVYLSLFPKGYPLPKNDRIKHIMAHRLVEDKDAGDDMETKAKLLIDDLLGSCLLQQGKSENFVWLHDIIHDLALDIGGKEYNYNSVSEHTRHLFLGRDVDSLDKIELQATKVLRTLLCHGGLREFPLNKYITSLKRLRVLDLTGASFLQLSDSIGDLILLKRLELTDTKIEELPASIRKLHNLQTLLLDGSQIKKLPKEIGYLWNLRHLGLSDTSNLQFVAQGLGNLTCLRTLDRYIICSANGADSGCNIRELKDLRNLRGKLVIEHLERVKSIDDAKEALLQEKRHLEDLELVYENHMINEAISEEEKSEIAEAQEKLFQELQLPSDLKLLGVAGYCGRSFPAHWLPSEYQVPLRSLKLENCPFLTSLPDFRSLTCLHLYQCNHFETVPVVPQLSELVVNGTKRVKELPFMPALKKLSLENLEELNQVPRFPTLEDLKVKKLDKWNGWPRDMDGNTMPSLSVLEISECAQLESIPRFPGLMEIKIRACNNLCFLHEDHGGLEAGTSATLTKLKILKVEECHGLRQLPCLMALEELEMRNMNNWEGWSTSSLMSQLRHLSIFDCPKLKALPHFPALLHMEAILCDELHSLWDQEKHPMHLEKLSVLLCPRASFPLASWPHLSKLQDLTVDGFLNWQYQSAALPYARLPAVRCLWLFGHPGQDPLPNWLWPFTHLVSLMLFGITEGTSLQGCWQNLKLLEHLSIQDCPKLTTLEDFLFLQHLGSSSRQPQPTVLFPKLVYLDIRNCAQLNSLPEGLQNFVELKRLNLTQLPELTTLPQYLPKVELLTLTDCPKLSSLPRGLSHRLKTGLAISGCTNLKITEDS